MKRKYGGSGSVRRVRPRRYRRRPMRRYRRRYVRARGGLGRAVRSLVLKSAESKVTYKMIESTALYHNGGNSDNLAGFWVWNTVSSLAPPIGIAWPELGTNDHQRVGNEIYPRGIRIRMEIQCPSDRRSVKFRLFLVKFNSNQGDPFSKTDFFEERPSTNIMLDPLSSKFKRKKILDTTLLPGPDATYMWTVTPTSGQQENRNSITKFFDFFIPLKRKLVFDRDQIAGPPKTGLSHESCVIIPFAYHNKDTAESDGVINVARFVSEFYYKDP